MPMYNRAEYTNQSLEITLRKPRNKIIKAPKEKRRWASQYFLEYLAFNGAPQDGQGNRKGYEKQTPRQYFSAKEKFVHGTNHLHFGH